MKKTDFSKAVTSYLAEYLPQTCGFSNNTINSYRYAFKLLLLFLQEEKGIEAHKIELKMIGRQIVSEFLDWLENTRNASVSTRNQRLAALKAFSKYAQYRYPDTITNCVDIITMRPKKQEKPLVAYLSEEELSVLLKQPNPIILHELRDLALMSLLYDTGARVQELVDLTLGDIRLTHPAMVILTGKGQKSRQIPLMKETCRLMDRYISRFHPPRAPKETPLFYNRDKKPLTRYGVTYILKKYAKKADAALNSKIISPHVLRHTKAMHLLRAGVNMIYIRDFLGHVEITTTEVYARIDAEMKRKVFEETVPNYIPETVMPWEEDEDLLEWLTHFGKKASEARCKILCKRFSTKSRMALESRADSGLNPLITESHGGQSGMRAGTA